jgi:hypothetical protein
MVCKIKQLDKILEDPNLWHDPERAAKYSRERGAIASRLKTVRQLENELAEHVGMAELGREENDIQVESVCFLFLSPFCCFFSFPFTSAIEVYHERSQLECITANLDWIFTGYHVVL